MNNRIQNALIWKEVRQALPVFVAFSVLTVFFVAYTAYMHYYGPESERLDTPEVANLLTYFTFFISMGVAYLLACGNRILEDGENLERFLYTRPVDRKQVLQVYYAVGFAGIALWILCLLVCIGLFFGKEFLIFNAMSNRMQLWDMHAGVFLVALLLAHGLTFFMGINYPSLVGTSSVFLGTYTACLFSYQHPRWYVDVVALFQNRLPLLLVVVLLVWLGIYRFERKQIG